MVEEALSNYGLFIDAENKIRLLDPERLSDSAELRDECKDFIDSKIDLQPSLIVFIIREYFLLIFRCVGIQENSRYIDWENGRIFETGRSNTFEGNRRKTKHISVSCQTNCLYFSVSEQKICWNRQLSIVNSRDNNYNRWWKRKRLNLIGRTHRRSSSVRLILSFYFIVGCGLNTNLCKRLNVIRMKKWNNSRWKRNHYETKNFICINSSFSILGHEIVNHFEHFLHWILCWNKMKQMILHWILFVDVDFFHRSIYSLLNFDSMSNCQCSISFILREYRWIHIAEKWYLLEKIYGVILDVGTCTCDLTINICDPSCCCDPTCTSGDKTTFKCSSRSNQFTT